MVKVSFGRPCHVPPCLINEEGGSTINLSLIKCLPCRNIQVARFMARLQPQIITVN